jgi:hypothetical protein
MTSSIAYSGIDENFPVAGQDNNSQGFRDNFLYVKEGLAQAYSEITDLQNNTAKLNDDNDFGGIKKLENGIQRRLNHFVTSLGTLTTATNIDTRDADVFTGTIGAAITITFGNWPSGDEIVERRIRLILTSNGSSFPLVFATSGGGSVRKVGSFPAPFNTGTNVNGDFIIEATKLSNRNIVYLNYLGFYS